jgi:hypothetical protein
VRASAAPAERTRGGGEQEEGGSDIGKAQEDLRAGVKVRARC